ncbi:MAG: hypothetical protein Q9160_000698 [Pyrenula sp. 1 TL-2023]
MLGRLLHTAASSLNPSNYSRNPPPLESTFEEEHTRSLLFPDASLLHQRNNQFYPLHNGLASPTNSSGGFDDRGGLDLDASGDLRVMIAQDALGDQDDPNLLLDTRNPFGHLNALSPSSPPLSRHHRGPSSAHQSPTSPFLPRFSPLSSAPSSNTALDRSRFRSQTLPLTQEDALHSIANTDTKDDTKALLNCMFGAAAPHSKSASTKLHIVTTEHSGSTSTSPVANHEIPSANRRDVWRREPLSRAHTYSSPPSASQQSHSRSGSGSDPSGGKDALLLTRMFSVNLPEAVESTADVPSRREALPRGSDSSYPFPDMQAREHQGPQKRKKLREKKTPAYAVSVLIQLPSTPSSTSQPSSRRSYNTHRPTDSAATSFGSEKQNSWAFVESPLRENYNAQSQADNVEQFLEVIVDRWEMVIRSLSHLEAQATKLILAKLKEIDSRQQLALLPKPPKEKSMQRTNQRIIQLPPYALSDLKGLRDLANHTLVRLAQAVNIPRVLCGQNRWGPFLDEARWVTRWIGGKEHNFFFFNLLTAFLGNHTQWLAFLGPEWHKRRYQLQRTAIRTTEPLINNRTILICPTKMAARRILFLLSSFLPGAHFNETFGSPLRPGTSMSTRCSSAHSPTFGQGSFTRQQSLRRALNKRATENRLASRSVERPCLSTSASSNEYEHLEIVRLQRKDSDTRSIKTEDLPIPANDMSTRKSSAATTSTVTPNPTTPIAHFSSLSARGSDYFPHRDAVDSQGSVASAHLLKSLGRSGSGTESEAHTNSSKWGSLISGVTFWSGRQDSSSGLSELSTSQSSQDTGQSRLNSRGKDQSQRSPSKLSQMVSEVGRSDDMDSTSTAKSVPINGNRRQLSAKASPEFTGAGLSPEIVTAEGSPLKLMVDEREGIVDVDFGLPGFFASSQISHPNRRLERFPEIPSSASLDGLASLHSHTSTANVSSNGGESTCINVAGWLKQYHEDFVLQSVRPYGELEAEIKASMSAEPTPTYALPASTPGDLTTAVEQWADVCSTLIADSRNCTIKRIRLRRKIIQKDLQPNGNVPDQPLTNTATPAVTTPSKTGHTAFETVEENFTTESIMDLDPTLIDAVERVIAQGSHRPSRTGSPSRSHHRSTSNASTKSAAGLMKDVMPPTLVFPPGECKKFIINALEDVVHSVAADLAKHELGRDIHSSQSNDSAATRSIKELVVSRKTEDNALREGVRNWLLSVEQMEGT